MSDNQDLPSISDVILKVKQKQELNPQEELLYLIHIEGLKKDDALFLINQWAQERDKDSSTKA